MIINSDDTLPLVPIGLPAPGDPAVLVLMLGCLWAVVPTTWVSRTGVSGLDTEGTIAALRKFEHKTSKTFKRHSTYKEAVKAAQDFLTSDLNINRLLQPTKD